MTYPFTPMFRTVLFLFCIVPAIPGTGFATSNDNPADSTYRRFQIGYERGISCRYFPVRNRGIGLIISSSKLYRNEYIKRESSGETDTYTSSSHSNYHYIDKNIDITLDGLQAIDLKQQPFTLHLFASVGGSYMYDSYESAHTSIVHTTDGTFETSTTSTDERITEETRIGGFGRIGIIPGVKWGRFSIALRLGIEGRYTKISSPEDVTENRSGHSTEVTFLYPLSLMESLIIHFDL